MQDHRLLAQVQTGVGVDRHVVGRDDGSILGGLQFAVAAEAVPADCAIAQRLFASQIAVIKRGSPQIRLHAHGVGILFTRLLGGKGDGALRIARWRLCVGRCEQGKAEADGECKLGFHYCFPGLLKFGEAPLPQGEGAQPGLG
ncbi:hypothetical protein D3C78_1587660 [compost metagenome]